MINNTQKNLLIKLLLKKANRLKLGFTMLSQGVGATLFFLALLLWQDFQAVLHPNSQKDDIAGSYLTVSKQVTDLTMGSITNFSKEEINELKTAPQVKKIGLLTPASFRIEASMGVGNLGFQTLLFFESVPDDILETVPPNWKWKEDDAELPILLSRDFLNMYNFVFAPTQNLPQLSENTVKAIGFDLTLGEGLNQAHYKGKIVGFSDRISSVLVPQAFMDFSNKKFTNKAIIAPSRVLLKVVDPSSNEFIQFLNNHHYQTNTEQLKFNKMQSIVQIVVFVLALISMLIIISGLFNLILFIENLMSQSAASLSLLKQLGYSSNALARFVFNRFLPLIIIPILVAWLIILFIQFLIHNKAAFYNLKVTFIPNTSLWFTFLGVLVFILLILYKFSQSNTKKLQ